MASPLLLNHLSLSMLINNGSSAELIKVDNISLVATERWYLVYVECFSYELKYRIAIFSKKLIIITIRDEIIETILTSHCL